MEEEKVAAGMRSNDKAGNSNYLHLYGLQIKL